MRFTESIKGWGPCDCSCFMLKVWLPSPVFVLELQTQNVGGHATAVPLLSRSVSTVAGGLLLLPVLTVRRCHNVTTGAFLMKADKKRRHRLPHPINTRTATRIHPHMNNTHTHTHRYRQRWKTRPPAVSDLS